MAKRRDILAYKEIKSRINKSEKVDCGSDLNELESERKRIDLEKLELECEQKRQELEELGLKCDQKRAELDSLDEQERLLKERMEQERLECERLEQERLARECTEQDNLEGDSFSENDETDGLGADGSSEGSSSKVIELFEKGFEKGFDLIDLGLSSILRLGLNRGDRAGSRKRRNGKR